MSSVPKQRQMDLQPSTRLLAPADDQGVAGSSSINEPITYLPATTMTEARTTPSPLDQSENKRGSATSQASDVSPFRTRQDEGWTRPGISLTQRWSEFRAEQRASLRHAREERRRLGVWRFALHWIKGPDHPPAMHIKHYPWWPWGPIERKWISWTDPIAWKDPALSLVPALNRGGWPAHKASTTSSDMEVEIGLGTGVEKPPELRYRASSASAPFPPIPSPEEEERDSQGDLPSAWSHGVVRDLRLNFVHWLLLALTCIGWIFGFSVITRDLWYRSSASLPASELSSTSDASDTSVTGTTPVSFFSCTTSFWSYNGGCGLDGQDCAPFASTTGTAFRCPKNCLGTTLGAVRAVGNQTINWVPLLVGGGDGQRTYRADSWVCQSAVQAGLFSDSTGGCGVVNRIGTYSNFRGIDRNGAHSESFSSTFPMAYRFLQTTGGGAQCQDQRWRGYVLDTILSAWTSFVLRPKTIVLYWILVVLGFWHINMVSEPRSLPPPIGEAFGDFLPCLFGAYVLWKVSIRFVLPAFRSVPIEGSVLWLAWYWIGTLLDVVFANVPLQRLVGSDLSSQPGAIPSLVVIIVVIVVLAINQVIFVIRRQGYLPKYLALYATGGIIVGLLAAIPGEVVRVHHYILGLVLLPGVGFPTRISLMAAALLLGMYLNGIGRWGFDGLLQDADVVRGDGPSGSYLPSFRTNAISWNGVSALPNATGSIQWDPIPRSLSNLYDSVALLVDDVLRYQGSDLSYDLGQLYTVFDANTTGVPPLGNTSVQAMHRTAQALQMEPHYLRLAYVSNGNYGDYTKAAIAYFNGTWFDPPAGRT